MRIEHPKSRIVQSFILLFAAASLWSACGGSSSPSGAAGTAGPTGSGGAGGAGGATASSGTGGVGEGGAGGSGGSAATVCDPPLKPVAPSGTEDVTYTDVPKSACIGGPCLCAEVAHDYVASTLACEPVTGGYWWGQGSVYSRVAGRKDGACLIDVGIEVEGGVSYYACKLPLPIEPWPGIASDGDSTNGTAGFLEGIEDKCEMVGSCCVLDGCPKPCDTTLPDVPRCPLGQPSNACP